MVGGGRRKPQLLCPPGLLPLSLSKLRSGSLVPTTPPTCPPGLWGEDDLSEYREPFQRPDLELHLDPSLDSPVLLTLKLPLRLSIVSSGLRVGVPAHLAATLLPWLLHQMLL